MIQDLKNDFKNDLCDTFKALYQLAASEFCVTLTVHKHGIDFKDLNSTVAKRGSVFIGLMTSDGAVWFRYQRAVLMR